MPETTRSGYMVDHFIKKIKGETRNFNTALAEDITGAIQKSKTCIFRSINMIKKPYGSILENWYDCLCGNNPIATRPPSSGGNGNRLKANINMFVYTPAPAMRTKNASSDAVTFKTIKKTS